MYATTTGRSQQLTPAQLALEFSVSRNEEHVEVKRFMEHRGDVLLQVQRYAALAAGHPRVGPGTVQPSIYETVKPGVRYSRSPAASRASARCRKFSRRITLGPRKDQRWK